MNQSSKALDQIKCQVEENYELIFQKTTKLGKQEFASAVSAAWMLNLTGFFEAFCTLVKEANLSDLTKGEYLEGALRFMNFISTGQLLVEKEPANPITKRLHTAFLQGLEQGANMMLQDLVKAEILSCDDAGKFKAIIANTLRQQRELFYGAKGVQQ